MDIVQQPDFRAVNLWFAQGVPQPAATAETMPMELLVDEPAAIEARAYHEREQQRRGDHPHDHGRYIQTPFVHSVKAPIQARYRTLHVDLPAWAHCPPVDQVTRIAVVLTPDHGEPIAYVAEASDTTRRRYTAQLPLRSDAPGWLAPGIYRAEVLAWVVGDLEPSRWTPRVTDKATGERELTIELSDEPVRLAQAA